MVVAASTAVPWELLAGCLLFAALRYQGTATMEFETLGLEAYTTNEEAESKLGVWITDPRWGGREFLIMRSGGSNEAYNDYLSALGRPHRRQIDRGTVSNETLREIQLRAHLRHVVKDWKGVNDADGNPVPYNEKTGRAFFAAFPELFLDIVDLASSHATFQQAQLEEAQEDLGNS